VRIPGDCDAAGQANLTPPPVQADGGDGCSRCVRRVARVRDRDCWCSYCHCRLRQPIRANQLRTVGPEPAPSL